MNSQAALESPAGPAAPGGITAADPAGLRGPGAPPGQVRAMAPERAGDIHSQAGHGQPCAGGLPVTRAAGIRAMAPVAG